MLIILALIGFISTTKLTHCAFSLCPVYCYLLMAVIAMDSTLENELSEATCTMLQSGLVRDRPFTHIFMVAVYLYFLISVLMETLYKYRGYGHEEVKWKS